ncbi:MAG: GNAT family N-acetyltransferase [Paracoccaceae bacterium]
MELRFVSGLPEGLRRDAARLYLEAFGPQIRPILGRDGRAEAWLAATIRPANAVAALDETGALVGLTGYHDARGGFIGGGDDALCAIYGRFGALWRGALLKLFERAPRAGEILIDGVAVCADQRGRGIGAALIERLAVLAEARGATAIRLEVMDANTRARALYERRGFVAVEREKTRLPRLRRSAAMRRRVGPPPDRA